MGFLCFVVVVFVVVVVVVVVCFVFSFKRNNEGVEDPQQSHSHTK